LNQLEQLKEFTKVVADSGRFRIDQAIQPQDADDESELGLYAATQSNRYAHLIEGGARDRKKSG